MTPTVATDRRADGTFAAILGIQDGAREECTHKHSNIKAATACGWWEANARAKGGTHWNAPTGARTPRSRVTRLTFDTSAFAASMVEGDHATDDELAHSHEYVPMPDLVNLWHAVVTGAKSRPADNLMFLGPSGSGKTDGARYLAALAGLPFAKVDAASMTDPEAWFGTREIVVHDGVAVTEYRPSAFVEALGRPGVLLIDEVNRVRDEHRNVLLPLLDATRSVTNPLTGDLVRRDSKCFVVMSGNVGIHFTGTSAIDPAFMTRALTVEFTYIDPASEARVVCEASGCSDDDAVVFVRFAGETRAKAASDPEFLPISTRELIEAGRLVADGLSRDLAVKFVVFNAASSEGGSSSLRQELQNIWNGVRTSSPAARVEGEWTCPTHVGKTKFVPPGVSAKTGRPYNAFWGCPVLGCQNTSDHNPAASVGATRQCPSCGITNPVGRMTVCASCGAAL